MKSWRICSWSWGYRSLKLLRRSFWICYLRSPVQFLRYSIQNVCVGLGLYVLSVDVVFPVQYQWTVPYHQYIFELIILTAWSLLTATSGTSSSCSIDSDSLLSLITLLAISSSKITSSQQCDSYRILFSNTWEDGDHYPSYQTIERRSRTGRAPIRDREEVSCRGTSCLKPMVLKLL